MKVSVSKKRLFTLFLVLALVVLSAAGSWIAGMSIQSPAEMAARTAPPTPSPILVPVEKRVLSSAIVTRGTARFGLPRSIAIVPSALKPKASVITKLPLPNTQMNEGDVLLAASGRPLFVLRGESPAYRDLVPGISGDDVGQLERGLKRLGFDPGPIDGTYDERTGAAVAAWYSRAGWQPLGATTEQVASIRALERQLAVAVNDKLAAADTAAAAPRAVAAARANAARGNRVAAAAVAAKTALQDKVLGDPSSTKEDRARANADLELAQAAAVATQLAGEVEIQAALDAEKAAVRATRLADETAGRLAADLDIAQRKVGLQVPVDEIVFVPALPVRVEQVKAAVGDTAGGPVMTVTNNQVAIDSSLPLDEARLVRPGMAVAIDEPALGIKATGVVKRVADTPGTDGVDGYHIYFETLVHETPTALAGFSLRLTIPIKSTQGAVTAVPVSALSLAADGTSRVQVHNNGALEFIVVQPGLSADGFVEVTPVSGTLAPGQLVVIGYEKQ
jgi:peptidoglycan hydrolase-like protein with peptidoglycan-binding domain